MNLAFAIAALGGCGADLPPIEITGLEPGFAYNGEAAKITVVGRNFYPSVTASSFAEPQVESQFRAWVETDPPTEVDYAFATSLTTLEVQIPEGIEATGEDDEPYAFTVESADGNRDTLAGALQVTDTPADSVFATVDDASVLVGQWVTIRLEILDPEDRPVLPYSLQVDVAIVGGTGVEFESDTLDDQTTLEGGGIRGTNSDGGYIRVTTQDAGPVTLLVKPSDPTSTVDPAEVNLSFSAGAPTALLVAVSSGPEGIVAGVPVQVQLEFRDEDGNRATDAHGDVTLEEACGSPEDARTFPMTGSASVTFPLVRATGSADCSDNYLIARSSSLYGTSQSLTVLPGEPAQLGVSVVQPILSAGVREGIVSVTMEDAYGNELPDYETLGPDLTLEDNVDGLEPDDGTGWQECDPFVSGVAVCTVELWRVGNAVRITAKDGAGLVGTSQPFKVIAGAPAYIEVTPQLPVVQAGDDLQVRIYVTDGPGNVIHVDDAPGVLHITDENEAPLECQYEGIDPTLSYEVHVFECQLTQVGTHRISVDMASEGLYDFESFDIAVQNGELYWISIDLGMTSVGAGMTFYADFVGTDFWGNPYVVQSDPDIDVTDASGTLTPTSVHLDSTGKALDQPMNVKVAALSNRLVARQDGAWLGSSPVFAITAGAFHEFLVDVDGPVVSIADPGIVLVSAVDQYGNAIPSYDDPVSLSSTSGLGNRITIDTWVDGRAAVAFPFDALGEDDTLVADDGVTTGESTPFDVVDFGCPAGPTAILDLGSPLPLRLCLVPGMSATTFDLSSSIQGADPIETYYYLRGDGTAYRSTASGWTTSWTQPGSYPVSGIVIDQALCASESSGWVYAGYDDGQPVGTIDVDILGGATSVHADTGWVTVDVRGKTCAGDPAIAGMVLASVNNGTLDPTTGTNRYTGSGIELALDAFGTGSIEWNMFDQPQGGIATFVAGARSGAAHGEVTVDIDGDSSHPTVLEVSPVGTLQDDFASIAILFSDPMQAASIDTTSVELTDPFGALIGIDDLTLTTDGPNAGRELIVDFPVQAADAGAYTLTLASSLRKAPGPYDNANTLDGNYDALPTGVGDFVLSFGAVVETAPDLLACDPTTTLFRPDGDDGEDPFEADAVELDLSATGPAAFWLLEVFDPFGDRVFVSHSVAHDSDTGTVSWDGRGSDGAILENGTYTVAVTAKDASWNEGAPCLANVAIDNLLLPVGE